MTKSWQRWLAVVALVSFVGCSKAPSEPKAATPPANQTGAATSAPLITGQTIQALTPASEVVTLFLESLMKGDAARTRGLLTEAAKAEIESKGYSIDPLGSSDSKFKIGRTQYSDKDADAAFVEAEWTEPLEDGKTMTSEVVFTVHKENNEWRISGLALEAGEPGNMAIVDFENMPEIAPATQAPTQTATTPGAAQPATNQQPNANQPSGGYSLPPQVAQPLSNGTNSLR